jgi:hypothetical protein
MPHDLDRTLLELSEEEEAFDSEPEGEGDDVELEGQDLEDQETGLDEIDEVDLASELMEVTSEAELEQFLGKLLRKVSAAARSPAGRALTGILKNAAKKALPVIGGAVGTAFGGPAGGMLGSKLAGMAGKTFGLELEGLSPQDQELETRKAFVRLAGAAGRNLDRTASRGAPPVQAAAQAVSRAAREYAPGVLRATRVPGSGPAGIVTGQAGRWIRRGRRIILLDVL